VDTLTYKPLILNTDNQLLQPEDPSRHNHPVSVYFATLRSDNSRRAMENGLVAILDILGKGKVDLYSFPFWEMGYQHLEAIKSRMLEMNFSTAKTNQALSAVRGVVKHAYKLDLVTAEHYHKLSDVENIKMRSIDAAAGRQISADEMQALLTDCDDTTLEGARDKAIIVLGLRAGLRRSEIANLERGDYDRNTGKISILAGKGRKDRTVYLANTPKLLVDNWLDLRGKRPGKMFGRIIRNQSDLTGLTAQTVMDILKKHAKNAGLTEPVSPHDMRRSFIGDALDAGIDLATVADIVGHASTDTTRRYDRRGERRKQEAAKKLDL
jgi:integrase/recombinase XerD